MSVAGCSKPKEQVMDGEQKVQVLLNDREFLVPKKYIENPQKSVETPLIFKDNQGMIGYFYWPNLAGLSETDRPYVWDYHLEVVEMNWRLLSQHYISAKQYGINIKEDNKGTLDGKCKWDNILCFSIKDKYFYKWVGEIDNIGSFYIRCPKDSEREELLENIRCNLDLDYDQKDLYIDSQISSSFIKNDSDFPKIIYQMKTFLDEWEVKK